MFYVVLTKIIQRGPGNRCMKCSTETVSGHNNGPSMAYTYHSWVSNCKQADNARGLLGDNIRHVERTGLAKLYLITSKLNKTKTAPPTPLPPPIIIIIIKQQTCRTRTLRQHNSRLCTFRSELLLHRFFKTRPCLCAWVQYIHTFYTLGNAWSCPSAQAPRHGGELGRECKAPRILKSWHTEDSRRLLHFRKAQKWRRTLSIPKLLFRRTPVCRIL
jgi:hypothetical protein